jgi:hypothetical protein
MYGRTLAVQLRTLGVLGRRLSRCAGALFTAASLACGLRTEMPKSFSTLTNPAPSAASAGTGSDNLSKQDSTKVPIAGPDNMNLRKRLRRHGS